MTAPAASDPADALYDVAPPEFVAARDRLASELKKAGKKAEAAAVKATAKPSASVFAINRVARRHPAVMAKFLSTSEDLRQAQTAGAGSAEARVAYRTSFAAQREALERVLQLAVESLRAVNLTPSRAAVDKLRNDLRYAVVDEETRARLREGRLQKDLEPPDFAALVEQSAFAGREASEGEGGGAAKSAAPAERAKPAVGKPAAPADDKAKDKEAEAKRRAAREHAKQELRFLHARQKATETEHQRTRDKAGALDDKVARAERALESLRRQVERAEAELSELNEARAEVAAKLDAQKAELTRIKDELGRAEAAVAAAEGD